MKLECAGCKRIVSEDAFDDCYAVYKCRKDHIFVCCKIECQRVFEKRCAKVADNLLKMQHKLNNDGHTSALRRLPPCEREKFKQHSEAEANGLMICPEEVKACERSVPNCAHIIQRTGGSAAEDARGPAVEDLDGDALGCPPSPPPPPPGRAQEAQDQELVGDDMLEVIRRDEDLVDEQGAGNNGAKAKKAQKGRKEKKGQPLLIDWKTPPVNSDEVVPESWAKTTAAQPKPFQPAPYTPAPARTPGGLGAAQWSAVASRLGGEAEASRPMDCLQRAKTLASTTGCTDQRAVELLERHGWDLDKAADAFFRQAAGPAIERPAEGPRWGPRAGQPQTHQPQQPQPQPQLQQQQQQQQQQEEQQEEEEEEQQEQEQQPTSQADQAAPQPPAPSQPPPPRLPPDWQAIWAETQHAYYYWHLPTNRTTWDAPDMDDAAAARAQQAAATESARREAMVSEAREIVGIDAGAARSLLEAHDWNMEAAIRSHVQKKEAKRRADEEAAAVAEEAKRRAAEEEARLQAPGVGLGTYVITRHWRPRLDIRGCIRLFHGERVKVTWSNSAEEGWAYGNVVEETSKEGYFPQSILRELKHQPRGRRAGETCTAVERFEAPAEVGGYASVGPGDTIKVLHPSVEPCVWVYAERVSAHGAPEVGWVPECILNSSPAEVQGDGRQGEQGARVVMPGALAGS